MGEGGGVRWNCFGLDFANFLGGGEEGWKVLHYQEFCTGVDEGTFHFYLRVLFILAEQFNPTMERNNNNFWSCCQTFASGQRKLLSHAYCVLRYLTCVTEVTPLFSAPCTAINAKLLFSLSWSNRFELSRTVTKSVHKTVARFRREGVRQKYKLN